MSTEVLDVPSHFQTFLALDFGIKRTGVAVGNRLLRTATPQATIKAQGAAQLAAVEATVREWRPDALVVGVPFHPDGASHDNTVRARKFARELRGRLKLPVFEVVDGEGLERREEIDAQGDELLAVLEKEFASGLGVRR